MVIPTRVFVQTARELALRHAGSIRVHFALPPPGQFGTAGRNSLKGPKFAQFDLALRKTFHLPKETEIAFGAEAFNVLNHPNFAVPSNTQSPLTLGERRCRLQKCGRKFRRQLRPDICQCRHWTSDSTGGTLRLLTGRTAAQRCIATFCFTGWLPTTGDTRLVWTCAPHRIAWPNPGRYRVTI